MMAEGGVAGVDLSRKFVSEAELDKRRQKRQEEWEKVRKPDDPQGKNHLHTDPKLELPPIIILLLLNSSSYQPSVHNKDKQI